MATVEWNAVPAKMTDHPSVEAIRTIQCHLLFFSHSNKYLRWLVTVSCTFQDLEFDGLL